MQAEGGAAGAAAAGGAAGEAGVGGSGGVGGSAGNAGSAGAASTPELLCAAGGTCVGTWEDIDGSYFLTREISWFGPDQSYAGVYCDPKTISGGVSQRQYTRLVRFEKVGDEWFLRGPNESDGGLVGKVTWTTTSGTRLTFKMPYYFPSLQSWAKFPASAEGTIDLLNGTLSIVESGAAGGTSCHEQYWLFLHEQGHLVGRPSCASPGELRPCASTAAPTAVCDGSNAGALPKDEDFRGICGLKDVFPGGFSSITNAEKGKSQLTLKPASAEVVGVPKAEWPEGAWSDQRHSALLAAGVTGGDFIAEIDAPDLMVRATDVAGPSDERWLTALGKTTAAGVTSPAPLADFSKGRGDQDRFRVCRIGTTYRLYSLAIAPLIYPWPAYGTGPKIGWTKMYTIDRADLAGAVHVGVPVDRASSGPVVLKGLRFGHVTSEADCTAPLY